MRSTSTLATHDHSRRAAGSSTSPRVRLYLDRGALAIVWSLVLSAMTDTLTTGVGLLLVVYPLIDAVASVLDLRGTADASARRLLRVNAVASAVAAVALGIAATGTLRDVLSVFGVWAVVSGAAQLLVALRRRGPRTGSLWPMLLAGGLSVLAGVFYLVTEPVLSNLVVYTAGGGVWFLVQGLLLARRERRTRS